MVSMACVASNPWMFLNLHTGKDRAVQRSRRGYRGRLWDTKTSNRAAIEIKGGTDKSNAHNRAAKPRSLTRRRRERASRPPHRVRSRWPGTRRGRRAVHAALPQRSRRQPREDRLLHLRRRLPPWRRSFRAASAHRGGIPVTHEYPRNPTLDSVGLSRVSALSDYALTVRQRQCLVTVMVHPGCFLERQYCTFTTSRSTRPSAAGQPSSPSPIDRPHGREGDDSRRRAERSALLVVESRGGQANVLRRDAGDGSAPRGVSAHHVRVRFTQDCALLP